MTLAVFLYPNRATYPGQRNPTHKIQNITKIHLNMFYLTPDDIKRDMK